MEELNPVARRLREQGYRLTPQRLAIVEAVFSTDTHPTAEEIYQRVASLFPTVSLATVYKTLHVLKDLGEVTELRVNARAHYERNAAPHPHLICKKCHCIIDLPAKALAEMDHKALAGTHFRDLRTNVEVYGVCPCCQGEQESHLVHKEA